MDGGCITQTRSGGWAAILIAVADCLADPMVPRINQQTSMPHMKGFSGHVADTTVNQMEIVAVLQGLRHLHRRTKVRVISVSNLLVKTMTEGWKREKDDALWRALAQDVAKHDVSWGWAKGHATNHWNNRADALVKQERGKRDDTTRIDDVLA
jgi:ribonuclease HI